jgi:potassium/hydrogen antiporter
MAPTDPAVVFSVLGSRRIAGRSAIVLKGEAGLKDPVGIALMVSVLGAAGSSGSLRLADILVIFLLQMLVGATVGVVGGKLLAASMRRMRLPSEGCSRCGRWRAPRSCNGAATVAHGSGFLAVFLAGILIGEEV